MNEELFEKYLQDRLSDAEKRRLSDLLGTEEGSRAFAEFVREWSLVADVSRSLVTPSASPARGGTSRIRIRPVPKSTTSGGLWWAAGIAATLIFAAGLMVSTRPTPRREAPPAPLAERPRPEATPAPRGEEPPPPAPRLPRPEAPVAPAPAPVPRPPEEKPLPPAPPSEKPVPPEPAPKKEEPGPAPAPGKPTVTVLASIESVRGTVTVVGPEGRRPAEAGQDLLAEQGLETGAGAGFAAIKFPDQTRFELGADSFLEKVAEAKGRTVLFSRGTLMAVVTKQVAGKPLILRTPNAEAAILGTQLSLVVTPEATRLEVREGRVKLTRLADGASVEVGAGRMAVAAKGVKLEVRPLVLLSAFQDGAAPTPAYSGTRDTELSGAEPSRNFGGADVLVAQGSDPEAKKIVALFRWDISDIPAGSAVRSATITLNVTDAMSGSGSYTLFEMKRPWVEGEATWKQFSTGAAWGTPGGRSSQDRGTQPLGQVSPREKGGVTILFNAAGEALVQSWIRNPSSNHGIVIAGDTALDEFKFSSRESSVAGRRPKLTIEYIPGASR